VTIDDVLANMIMCVMSPFVVIVYWSYLLAVNEGVGEFCRDLL